MFNEEGYELRAIARRLRVVGGELVRRAVSSKNQDGVNLLDMAVKINKMVDAGDNK